MKNPNINSPLGIFSLILGGSTVLSASIFSILINQHPGCACVNSGLAGIETINRAQQGYHFEHQTFMSSPDTIAKELGHSSWKTTKGYQFKILSEVQIAFSFAAPHQSYFQTQLGPIQGPKKYVYKSYVGAIAFNQKLNNYTTITCISKQASAEFLDTPMFDGQNFACPPNAIDREDLAAF